MYTESYREKKHTGWLIMLSIIFILLIATLLYGAYYATTIILKEMIINIKRLNLTKRMRKIVVM